MAGRTVPKKPTKKIPKKAGATISEITILEFCVIRSHSLPVERYYYVNVGVVD